jgi:hypothetical protein
MLWTMRRPRENGDPCERVAPRIRKELAPLLAALAQETDRTRRHNLERELRAKRRELLTPQPFAGTTGDMMTKPTSRSCRLINVDAADG